MKFDSGPPQDLASLFETLPDHRQWPDRFRLEWGPIYYRGRTDGSAKVLVIGQDASSEEDIARRCFVGNAGRRVQGFLDKAGITQSYAMVNAFAFSIYGQFDAQLREISENPAMLAYRNAVFDYFNQGNLEAVIAFGRAAQHAVDHWPGAAGLFVARPFHPSARPVSTLLDDWRFWLPQVRTAVTAEPGSNVLSPNYGTSFRADERPPIPRNDLPFGMPSWFGKRYLKTTRRDGGDTIKWKAPVDSVG